MIDLTDAGVVDFHAHMSLQIGVGELIRRDVTTQLNLFHGTPGTSYRWDDLEPAPTTSAAWRNGPTRSTRSTAC